MMKHVLIVGTGLIGWSSIGLALKEGGFGGTIDGWDGDAGELATSLRMGAIDKALASREEVLATRADVVVLATPVLAILDWMQRLAPHLADTQLVTDAGSTKLQIATLAGQQYNQAGRAGFLPGHPMAGKEHGGAQHAEANLFRGATWLFTPCTAESSTLEAGWRAAVARFGAHTRDMNPAHHDQLCAGSVICRRCFLQHSPRCCRRRLPPTRRHGCRAGYRRPRSAGDYAPGCQPLQHVA